VPARRVDVIGAGVGSDKVPVIIPYNPSERVRGSNPLSPTVEVRDGDMLGNGDVGSGAAFGRKEATSLGERDASMVQPGTEEGGSLGTTAFNPTVGSRLGNLPEVEEGGLLGERIMGRGSFVVGPSDGKRLPEKTLGPCFFVGDSAGGVENFSGGHLRDSTLVRKNGAYLEIPKEVHLAHELGSLCHLDGQ